MAQKEGEEGSVKHQLVRTIWCSQMICFVLVIQEVVSIPWSWNWELSNFLVHNGHDYESHEMEGHVEDGEESVQLLCCSFQKYLHCSESVVNTTCGYETARFTKSFLDRMSGPLIQVSE